MVASPRKEPNLNCPRCRSNESSGVETKIGQERQESLIKNTNGLSYIICDGYIGSNKEGTGTSGATSIAIKKVPTIAEVKEENFVDLEIMDEIVDLCNANGHGGLNNSNEGFCKNKVGGG